MEEVLPPTKFADLIQFFSEKTKLEVIEDLTKLGLLANKQDCSNCNEQMKLCARLDVSDGYAWKCYNCEASKSIRSGSFFNGSTQSLKQIIFLTYMWCHKYTVKQIKHELGISQGTITEWLNHCRETASNMNYGENQQIGGRGIAVEVGEIMILDKLCNQGSKKRSERFVFGGIEINGSGCFLVTLENRDASTYTGILQNRIRNGSNLCYTDSWIPHKKVGKDSCKYLELNNNITFSKNKNNKKEIDSLWHNIKQNIAKYDWNFESFDSYLGDFLYRRSSAAESDMFLRFLKDLGKYFKP